MPTFEVTLSDGKTYEIESNREPTAAEAADIVNEQFKLDVQKGPAVGQSLGAGMANELAQGVGKGLAATFLSGPGAVLEAVGMENNGLLQTGRAMEAQIEQDFPVSEENKGRFLVQAAGAIGQAGSMVAVYPFSGASTGFRAASMAGKARQIALLGGFQGASAGEEEATRLGINDPLTKALVIAGYGSAEFVSEKIGGYSAESGVFDAMRRLMNGEGLTPSLMRAAGQSAGEGLEEVGAGTAQRAISRMATIEDPTRPGFTFDGQAIPAPWDVGQIAEEFALGAIAGGTMTLATEVLNSMTPAQQRDAQAVAGLPKPIRQSTFTELQEVNQQEAQALALANNVDSTTAASVRLAMDGRRANILKNAAEVTTKEYAEGWQDRARASLVQRTDAGLTIQINGQWYQETGKDENGASILEPLTDTAKLEQEREEWIQTGEPPEGWKQPEVPAPLEGQPADETPAPAPAAAAPQPKAPAMGAPLQTAEGPGLEGEPIVFIPAVELKGLPDETFLPSENGGMYRIWTPAPGRKAVETIPPAPQPAKAAAPTMEERFPDPVVSEDAKAARTLSVQQKGKALAMWSQRHTTAEIADSLGISIGAAVEMKAQLGVPDETIPGQGGMIDNPAFKEWSGRMTARTRKRAMPANPVEGSYDILDFLHENPIYLPPASERGGEADFLVKDDRVTRYFQQFITTRDDASKTADVRADDAIREGLLPPGSTANELGEAVQQAITARKSTRAAIKREGARMKKAEGQTTAFYRDTADGPVRIDPSELVKGDVLIVENEPLEVTEVDYNEDGYVESVTLKDGEKYGVQTISGDYVFLVDQFQPSQRRPAAEAGTFLPEGDADPFALEETSAEELVAEAQRDRQRQEIAARQAAPLRGGMRAEDTTPDMLDSTAGGLFAQPAAPPVIPQPTPQVEEETETLDPYLVSLGRSQTTSTGALATELSEYTAEERTALQRILKTPDAQPRTLATALKQFQPRTGSRGASTYQTEARTTAERRDALDEQRDRDEGIVRARRRSMRTRDVVTTGVTAAQAQTAKEALTGVLPSASEAWIGRAADVREAPGLRTAFIQSAMLRDPSLTLEEAAEKFEMFAASLPGSKMEGFTVGGRPYLIIDEVGVTEEDGTPARAARRVLIHEDTHEAVEAAVAKSPELKAEWEGIKGEIAPEDLDALAAERYPWLANWRSNPEMHDDLAHEWIAEQMEILEKRGEPATGLLQRIMEFFRKLLADFMGEPVANVTDQRVIDFVEAGRATRSRERRLANPVRPSMQTVYPPMDTPQPPMPNEQVAWELQAGDQIAWNGPDREPSTVASMQNTTGDAAQVTFTDQTTAAVNAGQGFVRFSTQPTYSTWSAEKRAEYKAFHENTRIPNSLKAYTEFLGSPTHSRRVRQALAPMVEMARGKLGGYWGGEVEVSEENTERVRELAAVAFTQDDAFARDYSQEFREYYSPRVDGKPIHQGNIAAGVLQMEILDYATKLAATGDLSLVHELMPFANDVIIGDHFTMSNAGRALNARSQANRNNTGFWTAMKLLQQAEYDAAAEYLNMTREDMEELRAAIWSDEVKTEVEDAMSGEATTAEGQKHLQPGVPSEEYLMDGYMQRALQVLSEEERNAFVQFDRVMQRIDQLQQLKENMEIRAGNVVRPSMQEDLQAFNSPEQIQQEIDRLTAEAKELLKKFTKQPTSSLSKQKRKKVLDASPKAKKVLSSDEQAKKMLTDLENKPQREKKEAPAWKQTYTKQITEPKELDTFTTEMEKHGLSPQTIDKLYAQAQKSAKDRQDKKDAKTRERRAQKAAGSPEAFSAWVGGESQEGVSDFDEMIAAHVTPTGFDVEAFKRALASKFSTVDPALIEDAAERVQQLLEEREEGDPEPVDYDARAKNLVGRAIAKASDRTKALKDPMTEAIKSRMKGDISAQALQRTLQALGVEIETAFAVMRKVEEDIAARAAKKAATALRNQAERPTKTADKIIDDLATSQSDTLAWKKAAQTDPVRALVRQQIDQPMPDFVAKATALGVPAGHAQRLETMTVEENRRVQALKTAKEAARKAAEPTKTAESIIDTLDKQQTEWLAPENENAVRALAKKARRDTGRGLRREWFNEYQSQFEKLGVTPQAAQVLVSRLWQENQKDRVNAMVRRRESAAGSAAFVNSIVREIFGATLEQQASKTWRMQTMTQAFRDRGLTEEQAQAAATWFDYRFNERLKEAQAKAAQKAGRALDVQKPTLQKIIDAVRTRMLDPMNTDPVVQVLAQRAGFKPLTPAQFTRLAQLDQIMQTEGPTLRSKAAAEMLNIMLNAKPPKKWLDIITQSWINSALSSISTASLSAVHAVFIPARKIAFDFAGVMIDVVAKKTKPADAAGMYVNMVGNMISAFDNFVNTAKYAGWNDAYRQRLVEFINQMHSMQAEFQQAADTLRSKNSTAAEKGAAAAKLAFASTDYMRRILSTADEVWGGVIQEYVLRNEATRVLVQKGGLTPHKAAMILNAANNTGEIVLERHMKETGDATEAALVARDAVQEAILQAVREHVSLDAAEDVKTTMDKEAPMELGNRGPEEAPLWDIVNFGMEGFKKIGWAVRSQNELLGRMLTGFITVPANILSRSAYFTPLGIARALYKMGKLGGGNEKIAQAYEETMATDGQQRMRLIEGIAGTIGFTLLIALTSLDDDEEGMNITGAGPKSKDLRDAWLKAGHKPNHLEWVRRNGTVAFSIPWTRGGLDHMSLPFTMVGTLNDMKLEGLRDQPKNVEWSTQYAKAALMGLANQARFFGMKSLVSMPSQTSTNSLASNAAYYAAPFFPWAGFIKSVGRTMSGQTDQSSAQSAALAQLPFTNALASSPALNALGDPKGLHPVDIATLTSDRLEMIGFPMFIGLDPRSKDADLYRFFLQRGVTPNTPVRANLERVNGFITDATWQNYVKTRGESIKAEIRRQLPRLEVMTNDQLQNAIERISSTATTKTKKQLKLQ